MPADLRMNLPNLLSLVRLLGTPLLFVLVGLESPAWFVAWYVALGLTDWLDGMLARAWNQTTDLGSMLDSVADLAYYISTAWFLWALFPEYIRPNLPLLWICLGTLGVVMIYTLLRFGRVLLPHTHLTRTAAVLVVGGMLASFAVDTTFLFLGIILLYTVAFVEMILMFYLHGEVSLDTRTIFALRGAEPALPADTTVRRSGTDAG